MRLKYEPYHQINNYWHPLVKTGENPYEKNEPSLSLINSSRTANVSQLIPRKQTKKNPSRNVFELVWIVCTPWNSEHREHNVISACSRLYSRGVERHSKKHFQIIRITVNYSVCKSTRIVVRTKYIYLEFKFSLTPLTGVFPSVYKWVLSKQLFWWGFFFLSFFSQYKVTCCLR